MQHQKVTVSFSFMFWVRIVHLELSFTGHGEFSFQYFNKKKDQISSENIFLEKSMMFFKLIIKLQNEKKQFPTFSQ